MPIKSWNDLINDAGGAGGSYEPIPAGDYDFTVSEAEVKQSSNGKTMYAVRCKVEAGPHAERIVFHQFVISPENPNALAMFFRQMNLLGLGREFFAGDPADHQVADSLKGKRFRAQVQIRTWQGQEKNEIKQIFSAVSAGSPGGMPGGAARPPAPAPAPAAPAPSAATPPPAPAPAPEYSAPAAPAPAPAPAAPAPAPAPEPVQQEAAPAPVVPDQVPAPAPPAPPAPAAEQPAAAGQNAPAPPPF